MSTDTGPIVGNNEMKLCPKMVMEAVAFYMNEKILKEPIEVTSIKYAPNPGEYIISFTGEA